MSSPPISNRIPLAEPDLRGNEAAYLAACVRDNWVSSAGPFVVDFERRVAALAGARHAVAAVNGTAALYLALRAAGVEAGDHVGVPDFTFAATANAVLLAGATPVFFDVTGESWTLDPALVEEWLARRAPKLSAVIAVHALGHAADMDPLAAVCARAGVPLIEDAAAALGARYKGRPCGSLGDAAMFSFNGNKTVTAGGGGAVATNRTAWAERARALSTQARSGARYRHFAAGFNFRLTNVNAAIGVAQLERLDEMLAAKRRIAAAYDAMLGGRDDLRPMPRAAWSESACWLYSVLCASPGDADGLCDVLNAQGIEARHFWESLSRQEPYRRAPTMLTGVAAALSGRIVSLPCSSSLTAEQLDRVGAALAAWRGGRLKDAA